MKTPTTSLKLKGYEAKHLNILFTLQNLRGTFARSTRHHLKLCLVKVLFILQNLRGTFAESTRHHCKLCLVRGIYHTSFHYHDHFQKITHKISLLTYHFVTSLLKAKLAQNFSFFEIVMIMIIILIVF